jgi:hypothetical protein
LKLRKNHVAGSVPKSNHPLPIRNLFPSRSRLVGLSQPDVSRLLRGHLRDFSLERLLRLLLALDRDIEIVIRRRPRSRSCGRLSVSAA